MEKRYVIKGTVRIGDFVRIMMNADDIVQEKNSLNPFEMIKNMQGMTEELQVKAVLLQAPDTITIPYDEWNEHKYKIGDIVKINMTPEFD